MIFFVLDTAFALIEGHPVLVVLAFSGAEGVMNRPKNRATRAKNRNTRG